MLKTPLTGNKREFFFFYPDTLLPKNLASIIINGERLHAFLLGAGTRQISIITTSIQGHTGIPRYSAVKQEKEIKGTQIEKEEVKSSLFSDDLFVYGEKPKELTEKLELISNYSK